MCKWAHHIQPEHLRAPEETTEGRGSLQRGRTRYKPHNRKERTALTREKLLRANHENKPINKAGRGPEYTSPKVRHEWPTGT